MFKMILSGPGKVEVKIDFIIKYGVELIAKRKSIVLLSIIMLLLIMTFNSVQKSTADSDHSHHYTHDSLFHIHEHAHSQNTHSHHHSTNSISMLDYFCLSDKDNNIPNIERPNDIFKLSTPYSSDFIKELFKPPKYS